MVGTKKDEKKVTVSCATYLKSYLAFARSGGTEADLCHIKANGVGGNVTSRVNLIPAFAC
jgi:hypothetical protein